MSETHLTQELIDGTACEEQLEKKGLYAAVAKHPFITGGLVLAGAGLAYAVGKTVMATNESVARDVHVETSIAIDKTPEELYAFWRELTNLPLFMTNLESVTNLGDGKSHWVAKGIGGRRVEWDAEIYNEVPNETIAWRSLENADVVNAGAVNFKKAPTGHGTYVNVTVNYNPPAGKLGATIAQLFGVEPKQLIHEDLRRLKQYLEAGELPTIAGQTSGRAAGTQDEDLMEEAMTADRTHDTTEDRDRMSGTEQTGQQKSDEARGAAAATGNVEAGTQHQTGNAKGNGSEPTSATNVGDEAQKERETRAA